MPDNEHINNCLVCGAELVYHEEPAGVTCVYCGQLSESETICVDGHYICDACHGAEGMDFVEQACRSTGSVQPVSLASRLMKHPSIKMHGPEHHYLVGAVMLTAYHNQRNEPELKNKNLSTAKKRAAKISGGYCGFYGACGAAISTGIFMSLVTGSTPLSAESWGLCNQLTSGALKVIGERGGPRCCKRDTFLALSEAIQFAGKHLDVNLDLPEIIRCGFYESNKECHKEKCSFYPPHRQAMHQ